MAIGSWQKIGTNRERSQGRRRESRAGTRAGCAPRTGSARRGWRTSAGSTALTSAASSARSATFRSTTSPASQGGCASSRGSCSATTDLSPASHKNSGAAGGRRSGSVPPRPLSKQVLPPLVTKVGGGFDPNPPYARARGCKRPKLRELRTRSPETPSGATIFDHPMLRSQTNHRST
jgi:hypothetical protein